MALVTYPDNFSIECADLTKTSPTTPVGILLKEIPDKSHKSHLFISGISPNSPLQGSKVKQDQQLLAINGTPYFSTPNDAVDIIKNSKHLKFLVCDRPAAGSGVKIVTGSFWKHNPGVNFTSTRGRTLVKVNKVFRNGPFAGDKAIKKGDIILAVNGIPVSKPEEADRALRMPLAEGSVTVLHIIDTVELRINVMRKVERSDFKVPATDFSMKRSPHNSDNDVMIVYRRHRSNKFINIGYDPDTLHMYDTQPFDNLVAEADFGHSSLHNARVFFKPWYLSGVKKFMESFNKIIDDTLEPIEDLACEAAWKNDPMADFLMSQ